MAEQQSAGRGRLNRSWFSPFAANIYLSFSQYVNKDISELSGLSLIMGYAIVQALKDHGIEKDISIKWPNDILWQGKKLAGILMETRAECHGPMQIIIGIGLNVNMNTPIDNTINQPWTSIHHILGNYQDRNPLVASLINHVIKNLEEFDQQGFTADFIKRLQTYDHFYGKKITLTLGEESVSGIACGVNHLGHILLQHSDDRITAYSSADISILKNPSLCLTYLQ